jgi:hypothetical protein
MNPAETHHDEPRRRTKRNAAIGAAAGLLGGGAIGLLLTVPSLTSAASETGATGPAVVALQDDTTTTGTTDTTDTTDPTTMDPTTGDPTTGDPTTGTDRPDPTARLRETLQPLVDDTTITADQADAIAAYLAANRPDRGDGHRGPGGPGDGPEHGRWGRHAGFGADVLPGLLGIDAQTLMTELRSGSTIADIATAHGVDVQTVIDGLVADAKSHLDQAVTDGRITDAEAADELTKITERVTAMVNGERPGPPADAGT